jgi:aldose 1-epimerase
MRFEIIIDDNAVYPVITLKDTQTNCEAEIYSFGALLNSFSVNFNDSLFNVIDGFSSVEDAIKNITPVFKSTKLSPFVCRMKNGEYNFNQQHYKIENFYLKEHAIHGIVFDRIFSIEERNATDDFALVKLLLKYKGEDAGYPFNFNLSIEWKLEKENNLSVTTIITNLHTAPIPIADGWHPYFKTDVPVDECTLEFDGTAMLEFDETLIPTGKLKPTKFNEATSLKNIDLDNCFALDPLVATPRCILTGKHLQLQIETDNSYPYLQVFIPPHRKSIALENLSGAPDAFNNGLGLQILNAGESLQFKTTYQVKVI